MRIKGWRSRLAATIDKARADAFAPGVHDCGLFSAAIVEAVTGVDHGDVWRGKYKTLVGGYKLLAKKGFKDVPSYWAAHLPEIHPCEAATGDLASLDTPEGAAMGVVSGDRIFVLMPGNLGTVPLLSASRAFKV